MRHVSISIITKYWIGAVFLFLGINLNTLKSQSPDPQGYNPCALPLAIPAGCIDGSRTCDSYSQFPCSSGYCWAGGGIPDNAGIPLTNIVDNKVIEIGGAYTITQPNVTFVNCIFKMHGDSRINISPISSHSLVNITFDNCTFFGCGEMWQGIVVDGINSTETVTFKFLNSSLEDAYIGLCLDEGKIYSGQTNYLIYNNIFRNNHIGISNLRKEGKVNCTIIKNEFFQSAELADRTGSLLNVLMPDYPFTHAGINFIRTSAIIGISKKPLLVNDFRCLANGIISDSSRLIANNNHFHNIDQKGIWAIGGTLISNYCRFYEHGIWGIFTDGSNITARNNAFTGHWKEGMHILGTIAGQLILVDHDTIVMNEMEWETGIYVERPQHSKGAQSSIDHNTIVSHSLSSNSGILVQDLVDATDPFTIANNTINFSTDVVTPLLRTGINLKLANSDNLIVNDNQISVNGTTGSATGIYMQSAGGQNLSAGHIVRHNQITGVSTDPDQTINPLSECIHAFRVQQVDYCDNILDWSSIGFIFLGPNDIALRNNHINNHYEGLEIAGVNGMIGKQYGRGNEWALDPDACVNYAAVVYNSDPTLSEFITPEGNVLPWLPPNIKISPDPSSSNWFHSDNAPLDYCVPQVTPNPRKLTPYERALVLSASTFTGINLWDLKREVYSKLLIFPSLRGSGSPESAYFNTFNEPKVIAFSNVISQIRNAVNVPASYLTTTNAYLQSVIGASQALATFDENTDYSNLANLTDSWFAQRSLLLEATAANFAAEQNLINTTVQQMSAQLQSALTYNNGISVSQAYESARKTILELRIRHLLRQPITQSLYTQALAIAQQGEATVGYAATEAATYLAFCDQTQLAGNASQRQLTPGNQALGLHDEAVFQVTPNPSKGVIALTFSKPKEGTISIYSIKGERVRSLKVTPEVTQLEIELSREQAGIFLIVLSDNNGKVVSTNKVYISH